MPLTRTYIAKYLLLAVIIATGVFGCVVLYVFFWSILTPLLRPHAELIKDEILYPNGYPIIGFLTGITLVIIGAIMYGQFWLLRKVHHKIAALRLQQ